ncbi:hypothetical protein G6F22_018397 [Rhizopus arrhizus]|nr:hypothetical protein G6F22_018397 [Rhizopus arrhizus]KAG1257654.1 hypothetical protein G6F66_014668 [Rhizopus arrhizus]
METRQHRGIPPFHENGFMEHAMEGEGSGMPGWAAGNAGRAVRAPPGGSREGGQEITGTQSAGRYHWPFWSIQYTRM